MGTNVLEVNNKIGPVCEYCRGRNDSGLTNCKNCGAPLPSSGTSATPAHVHECPNCGRKLLALASPNCNYCGKRLPEDYIAAREADLKRISQLNIRPDAPPLHVGEAAHSDSSGSSSLLTYIADLLS